MTTYSKILDLTQKFCGRVGFLGANRIDASALPIVGLITLY